MNPEINEILAYLENRDDYVIWAGYAQYIHLGIRPSADVDIFVTSREVWREISAEMQKRGWKPKEGFVGFYEGDKLVKKDTTFDIIFSEAAATLFFNDKVILESEGRKVSVLSKEALFITKLGQLSVKNRTEAKRKRDWETVNELRKDFDLKKIRELIPRLPDSFWAVGWI
ncbi:MAG: hypothetical protein ABIH34_07600 [Nanoarchaeota archaeon]